MHAVERRITIAAIAVSILSGGCGSTGPLKFTVPPPTGTPVPSLQVFTTPFITTLVGLPVTGTFALTNDPGFTSATTTLSPITISGTNASAFSLTNNSVEPHFSLRAPVAGR